MTDRLRSHQAAEVPGRVATVLEQGIHWHDEETGQTIISGMGELHLEIIENRIIREKGVEVTTSPPVVTCSTRGGGITRGRTTPAEASTAISPGPIGAPAANRRVCSLRTRSSRTRTCSFLTSRRIIWIRPVLNT